MERLIAVNMSLGIGVRVDVIVSGEYLAKVQNVGIATNIIITGLGSICVQHR